MSAPHFQSQEPPLSLASAAARVFKHEEARLLFLSYSNVKQRQVANTMWRLLSSGGSPDWQEYLVECHHVKELQRAIAWDNSLDNLDGSATRALEEHLESQRAHMQVDRMFLAP